MKEKKLQIGDKVKLNSLYFKEGLAFFGKELKYPRAENHYFLVKEIRKNEPWNVVMMDGGEYKEIDIICEKFLEKLN